MVLRGVDLDLWTLSIQGPPLAGSCDPVSCGKSTSWRDRYSRLPFFIVRYDDLIEPLNEERNPIREEPHLPFIGPGFAIECPYNHH